MSKFTDVLAGRSLTVAEEAILPDQAQRTISGVMEHPLLRKSDEDPELVAINPFEDMK